MFRTKSKFTHQTQHNGSMYSMYLCDIVGLSTDTKPSMYSGSNGITEGSTFFEEDTSDAYMMKADGNWAKL